MRQRQLLCVLLIGLILSGCAGSTEPVRVSHDDASGQTSYETKEISLSDVDAPSGLSKRMRLYAQVKGSCSGAECTPRSYSVRFLKRGGEPLTLQNRNVVLNANTERLTWDDVQNRHLGGTVTVRNGTLAEVEVSRDQLATIGRAERVSGSVGGIDFRLPNERRSPIRHLLSQIE